MKIDILSLFPSFFKTPFETSILRRAIEENFIKISNIDIREFSKDKKRRVDDRPFGGGPGMVMTPQPVIDAIRSVRRENTKVIFLSPQGKRFDSKKAEVLAKEEHIVFLSGHYEGVDQRIIDLEVDEEISVGDYVLTNGCIATLVVLDAMIRFLPNVIGNPDSAKFETFQDFLFDAPQYTRPVTFEGLEVPAILRSGNFKEIDKFRDEKRLQKTKKIREDLYQQFLKKKAII